MKYKKINCQANKKLGIAKRTSEEARFVLKIRI